VWRKAWTLNEEQQGPTYEAVLERTGGASVLDVGCGTGVFLRLCADRGAAVAGIDGSEELLAVARERVPEADLRLGDLQTLPYADDTFDLVTGFGSFFYAADVVAALREAARVARGHVVVQTFGRPERCDLEALKPNPGTWRPELADELMPLPIEASFDLTWAYEYADDAELVTAIRAGGSISPPAERILRELAHCRRADGSYRVANEWHVVVARARRATTGAGGA
jgi:ubiquinone/menaquinone biosynthesis C-methylase UbiE